MQRHLWGEFSDYVNEKPVDTEIESFVPMKTKRFKLDEVDNGPADLIVKTATLKVKNPLVTQTIEVMKQTETLQSLIDTYSNKSETSNCHLNPCQVIPEVDFPPENAARFVADRKFQTPFWFLPALDTKFSRGDAEEYSEISNNVCRLALRKAVTGLLRVAGFTNITESALILFADATEEFIRNFIARVLEERKIDARNPTVRNLEKAYFALTSTSLTQVHNYFKHHLINRNYSEIVKFQEALQEYDKLVKEIQIQQYHYQDDTVVANVSEIIQNMGNSGSDGATAANGPTALTQFAGHSQLSESERNFQEIFTMKSDNDSNIQDNNSNSDSMLTRTHTPAHTYASHLFMQTHPIHNPGGIWLHFLLYFFLIFNFA